MKKSIVIRGSISHPNRPTNHLDSILNSIRSWFDGEIILSTWTDQKQFITNLSHSMIDEIVYTDDPGEINNENLKHFKRQILSSLNGFNRSTGDLVLLTRSDVMFTKDIFQYIDRYPYSSDILKVFDQKLLVSNMMTIRPDYDEVPNCFRICDWFQLGHRKDIERWVNILDICMNLDPKSMTKENCTESVWFLSVLKNKFGKLIDIYDSSNINNLAWEAIVNNFIVMDTRTSLNAENLNWTFLPEYGACYFSESLYEQLYKSIIE